jgi:small subunit ribosomal protein S9
MTSEVYYATGRRKTSSARVYLTSGKGEITVNDKKLDIYFGRKVAQMLVMQPIEMTELNGKLDINIKVKGGGSFGQAGAIRHGISRALISYDVELRAQLKKAGLLTRDDRRVERKKKQTVFKTLIFPNFFSKIGGIIC